MHFKNVFIFICIGDNAEAADCEIIDGSDHTVQSNGTSEITNLPHSGSTAGTSSQIPINNNGIEYI